MLRMTIKVNRAEGGANGAGPGFVLSDFSVSAFQCFSFSAFQCFSVSGFLSPFQEFSQKRAESIAKQACQTRQEGIERKSSTFAVNAGGCSNEVAFVDEVFSSQGGVTDEMKQFGFSVLTDEAVQYESVVDAIKKDRAAADVCRMQRTNSYLFSIVDCGGHAVTPRFEINRGSLAQKFDQGFLGVRKRSRVGFFFCAHGQKSHIKKVQKP